MLVLSGVLLFLVAVQSALGAGLNDVRVACKIKCNFDGFLLNFEGI
jgi:hypothetical protein